MNNSWPDDFRAGFTAIVGRPNAGKSTLTNALVGQKIAITANQPETTRRVIRGIVNRDVGQLILVDTPGLHRPRTLLGERLNDMVHESLADVDCVALCLPADEKIGPGDRFLLNLVKQTKAPIIAVITKCDKISREALATKLIAVNEFYADFAEIVPISAIQGEQTELLISLLLERMPLSPPLYPRDAVTDETEEDLIAEMIREASLSDVRHELPHSIAVVIEEMEERERAGGKGEPILAIHASVFVERDSQKGIVIGTGGARLKKVGQEARHNIERLLGRPVYLDIRVKVAKDWQRNPKLLGRLGF
ncbi:GTPase Era [Arcanobacterium bovis]|uniref:GTPase Era n=1 Tax=Arcanobacterium bovis TaxID=2529275 RepID=A0A4Q9V030_9ACTO|nr:GTPase Era [Arcanobacterium bovis]TBW22003.1 GTPase Era [Arcanobacterium bovis]